MKNIFFTSILLLMLFTACDNEQGDNATSIPERTERVLLFGVKTLNDNATKAALQTSKKWQAGATIKIKFLNGTAIQQDYVKQVAAEWLTHANLEFEYIVSGNADVKVAFDWRNDYVTWAYVGTENQSIIQNAPSVNFGFVDEGVLAYDDTKAQVLQMFGRVLGLVYEHQSPASTIRWNEPLLINYLRSMWWEEREINDFLVGLNSEESQYSDFDPKSIMVYYVPARYTVDGYKVNLNTTLSLNDIEFIKQAYPSMLIPTKPPKGDYYNGYEHNLPEPNWEKLKNINGMIGTTRDKDGNFYFYPYANGNIVRYDKTLTSSSVVAPANGSHFRNSPRMIPTTSGVLLGRKAYHSGDGIQCVNLTSPWGTEKAVGDIASMPYGGFTYDYDRGCLYHDRRTLSRDTFSILGTFNPGIGAGGILYWGDKYKWASSETLDGKTIFYVYEQSDVKDLYSKVRLVATAMVPGFILMNGAYTTIYEYNNKLVVVNSITSNILILSPNGTYNIYNMSNAKWTQDTYISFYCGGFYWKHKLMVYTQGYLKGYFEFPELMN